MRNNILLATLVVLLFEGLSFLMCIPVAFYYSEPLFTFFIPALISIATGFLLYFFSDKKFSAIKDNKESVFLIIVSWFTMILAGTLPYFISKTIPSGVDIFFETISGFTTTGTSVVPNIEQLPKSILFWRSLTHWVGGITTIVMFVAILPSFNFGGNRLFSLGLYPNEKPSGYLRPVIFRVFMIYLVLTVAQVLLLHAGGMNIFRSLCYSFGTVSTGCFSPEKSGIAGSTFYIQYIFALFMFLSGISYLVYYMVISWKKKVIKKNDEIRTYLFIILIATLLITAVLHFKTGVEIGLAFREGIFQVVSFVSTSGYSNTEYLSWPDFTQPFLYLLLIIGGCTGSAGGGIKMSRFLVLFRNFGLQFKNPANSETNISSIKFNGKSISEITNLSILTFISVFGIVFVLGTIALSFFVPDLKKSVFLAISALSNFGYHQNLSGFPTTGKVVLNLLMFLGKLEIFPMLLLFFPAFYKRDK
jgi:trk system potassium uptake protein TrkH